MGLLPGKRDRLLVGPAGDVDVSAAEAVKRCVEKVQRIEPELTWPAALGRVSAMLRYKLAR